MATPSNEMAELEGYLAILQQSKFGAAALDMIQPILADLDAKVDRRVYKYLKDQGPIGGVDANGLVAAWFEKLAIHNLRLTIQKLAAAAKDTSGPRLAAIGRGGLPT